MKFELMNGKSAEASPEEIKEFISQELIPNPYWRYSGLLTVQEVRRYLTGKSSQEELKKVARYILITVECMSFTCYLLDKADGEPDRTKEFNLPVIIKLRDLYALCTTKGQSQQRPRDIVHEMENTCMEIGADPL